MKQPDGVRAVAARMAVAALAVIAVAGCTSGTPAAPDAAQSRPNILVVMTDDQDVASMAVMPTVRRLLAAEGTTFTRSYASFPLCCPSRATYLTGQYSHNHGVRNNMPPAGGYTKLRERETVPVWLSRAGYATAHIGKYLNGYGRRHPRHIPPGWGEWYGSVDPSSYRMWGYTLNENGALRTYGRPGGSHPANYQTDVYAAKAADYIDRHAPDRRPFFLSVAPVAPHTELNVPKRPRDPRPAPRHAGTFAQAPLPRPPGFDERDLSDKPRYIRRLPRLSDERVERITRTYRSRLESLLAVDEAVGTLVNRLRAHGELDDTLIVFTSDNGWLQGEHRVPYGKIKPYEPAVRVPLILRGPGVPAGQRRHELVANVDLAPTLLDAANARAGIPLDGRSLLAPPPRGQRALLLEIGPRFRGEYVTYHAVRTGRYKYIEYATGERELYDLRADPYELESRHDDPRYADVRRRLAAELAELVDCQGTSCR